MSNPPYMVVVIVKQFCPSLNSYSTLSIVFFTINIPKPPIDLFSASNVMSGSSWANGLYGVPEFEVLNHLGQNFTYDVIQPRYVAEMINWCNKAGLDSAYNYKVLWFQPNPNATNVVEKRQNMPNDLDVRRTNTCNEQDFLSAGIKPDHKVICSPQLLYMDNKLKQFLAEIERNKTK